MTFNKKVGILTFPRDLHLLDLMRADLASSTLMPSRIWTYKESKSVDILPIQKAFHCVLFFYYPNLIQKSRTPFDGTNITGIGIFLRSSCKNIFDHVREESNTFLTVCYAGSFSTYLLINCIYYGIHIKYSFQYLYI